jgi:hypothetical protein
MLIAAVAITEIAGIALVAGGVALQAESSEAGSSG